MTQTLTLRLGDCIEVLQGMPDGSIGAVVTDPYSLKCQGRSNGPFGIGQEVHLPDLDEGDVKFRQQGQLPLVLQSHPDLAGLHRAIGVNPGIGVPEGAVKLQSCVCLRQEVVQDSLVSTVCPSEVVLGNGRNPQGGQNDSDLSFQTGNPRYPALRNRQSCGLGQFSLGRLRAGIPALSLPQSVQGNSSLCVGLPSGLRDGVGLEDFSTDQSYRPGSVGTYGGTQERRGLRAGNMRGWSSHRGAANTTKPGYGEGLDLPPQGVRATTGAGSLSSVLQPSRVCLVLAPANGAKTLDHKDTTYGE